MSGSDPLVRLQGTIRTWDGPNSWLTTELDLDRLPWEPFEALGKPVLVLATRPRTPDAPMPGLPARALHHTEHARLRCKDFADRYEDGDPSWSRAAEVWAWLADLVRSVVALDVEPDRPIDTDLAVPAAPSGPGGAPPGAAGGPPQPGAAPAEPGPGRGAGPPAPGVEEPSAPGSFHPERHPGGPSGEVPGEAPDASPSGPRARPAGTGGARRRRAAASPEPTGDVTPGGEPGRAGGRAPRFDARPLEAVADELARAVRDPAGIPARTLVELLVDAEDALRKARDRIEHLSGSQAAVAYDLGYDDGYRRGRSVGRSLALRLAREPDGFVPRDEAEGWTTRPGPPRR